MPEVTISDPVIVVLPLTVKLPVGIVTNPYKVCTSSAASPNWLEPEEYITDADSYVTFKYAMEPVPIIVKSPVIVPPVSGRYPGAFEAVCAYEADVLVLLYDELSA
jgi:hypothetical protein